MSGISKFPLKDATAVILNGMVWYNFSKNAAWICPSMVSWRGTGVVEEMFLD